MELILTQSLITECNRAVKQKKCLQLGTFFELIHPAAPPLLEVALLDNVAYLWLRTREENFRAISEATVSTKSFQILYFIAASYMPCLNSVSDAGKVGAVLYAQAPARVALVEALQCGA